MTDHERVASVLKKVDPEIIVHMAALSSVGYSYSSPTEVFRVNALATINLIERCREVLPNLKHFIFSSTTEIYGVTNDRPVVETTTAMPNSPYSVSKFSADRYAQFVWMGYQFPITTMRSTNSYGRVNDVNFLVEKTIMSMLTGKTVKLGDPSPIRDFMYVDDHVSAYMAVLNNREKSLGEIFNISTHESHKIVEVVHMIKRLTGFTGTIQWGHDKRSLDIIDHRINSDKIRNMLGWAPKYSLEEGLKLTIEKLRAKLQTTGTP